MTLPKSKDFEGKTIRRVDCGCVNVMVFHFTDGTCIIIETERFEGGIYGIVVVDK